MRKVPAAVKKEDPPAAPAPVVAPTTVEVHGLDVIAKAMEAATRAHTVAADRLAGLAAEAGKPKPVSFEAEVVDRDEQGRIKRVVFSSAGGR